MQLKTEAEFVQCRQVYNRLLKKSYDTNYSEAERRQMYRLALKARNACTQWSLDHIQQEQAS